MHQLSKSRAFNLPGIVFACIYCFIVCVKIFGFEYIYRYIYYSYLLILYDKSTE